MANNVQGLRFPCECVSGVERGYSDPWAEIANKRLLPNGTKEQIVNLVATEPRTISQLAEALSLSAPSVHSHVNDLMKSELLRESTERQKKHPTERYYEPNFPVFTERHCAEFQELCDQMAQQLVSLFENTRARMEAAFDKTDLADAGWKFTDITQCLYTNTYRKARTILEEQGLLATRGKHANGAEWIFWAEQSKQNGEP